MATEHVEETRRLRAVPSGDAGFPDVTVRRVHGYDRAYRRAGSGPPLLLVHGIGDSSETWSEVFPALAEHHDVIAPDLLGHGASDKPRADYSVGGFANGMRDLLHVLEVERVTVVGHSLGAGVAMQFAYQYPEMVERLVLVAAGGVSRSVSLLLRAATLPLAPLTLAGLELPGVRRTLGRAVEGLRLLGTSLGADADDVLRMVDRLPDAASRLAFARTLRAVVDVRGQVVTALDRTYLVDDLPILVMWGSRDAIIPPHHARVAHASLPGSTLEMFEGVGHFPHRSAPDRFVRLVRQFVDATEPAPFDRDRWLANLRVGRHGPDVHPSLLGRR